MTEARDLPAAIQWHEGMLLTPQHFQQADLRYAALLHHHTMLVSPFHWGVRKLEIDPELLGQGTFQIMEVEALMPDGLVVSHALGDGGEIVLDLKPLVEEMRRQPITVHLAVSAEHSGPSAADDELARYDSVEGRAVTDANTGEGEVRIPRLRPRLRLLATADPPKKFVSLPLARVAYRDETFAQESFIPPVLRVDRRSHLGKECLQIAARLREKATQLAEQAKSPVAAERAPQLLEKKIAAHSLAAALPPLEALLYTDAAHPYVLYLALCTVAGQVAFIGRGLVPPVLPPYEHNDLLRSFTEAFEFILRTLREGIAESYVGFPFYLEDDSFFIAFDPAWRGQPLILGVRARAGVSSQETAEWVVGSFIASQSRMAEMEKKRIPGAGRRPVESAGDLVPTRDVSLFALDDDPEFVVPDELLQVRNLDDPEGRRRPVEIILYVRKQS